jgi:hypothetical protein
MWQSDEAERAGYIPFHGFSDQQWFSPLLGMSKRMTLLSPMFASKLDDVLIGFVCAIGTYVNSVLIDDQSM